MYLTQMDEILRAHWKRLLDPADPFASFMRREKVYSEVTWAQMAQYYLLAVGWQPELVVLFVTGRAAAAAAFLAASRACGLPKRIVVCHLEKQHHLVTHELGNLLGEPHSPWFDMVEFLDIDAVNSRVQAEREGLSRALAYVHGIPSRKAASQVAEVLDSLTSSMSLVTVFADTYDLDYYPANYLSRLRAWRGYRSDIPGFHELAAHAAGRGGRVSSPEAAVRRLLTSDLPAFFSMQSSLNNALGTASPLLGTHWAYCVNARTPTVH